MTSQLDAKSISKQDDSRQPNAGVSLSMMLPLDAEHVDWTHGCQPADARSIDTEQLNIDAQTQTAEYRCTDTEQLNMDAD